VPRKRYDGAEQRYPHYLRTRISSHVQFPYGLYQLPHGLCDPGYRDADREWLSTSAFAYDVTAQLWQSDLGTASGSGARVL